MRLGPYTLSSNLSLAPLAGYTNLPMRLTVRELGGLGWGVTDLINARSLIERNPTALKLAARHPDDRPMAIQLFGSVAEEMRDAAVICQELGAEAVDINMGCPVRKVVQIGGGSAMMTELGKTAALVRGMIAAVKIPVTAKMRLGWDADNLTAPELARVLEAEGVAALCVHGRTRAQGFGGQVNLAGIRSVVQAVKSIPVLGNGDVTTPEAAKTMIDETGCAGVAIGRGAFYDPWIFKRTDHFLRTGEMLPDATFAERLQVMRRHFERYVEFTARSAARSFSARSRRGTRGVSARRKSSSSASSRSPRAPISKRCSRSTRHGGRDSATSAGSCCHVSSRRRCSTPSIRPTPTDSPPSPCPRARWTAGDRRKRDYRRAPATSARTVQACTRSPTFGN